MNNFRFLFFICAALTIVSCKSDLKTDDANTSSDTNAALPISELPNTGEGSYAAPVIPALEVPYVNLLVIDYWVAEFWVNHDEGAKNKQNKGFWWKFNPDGTMLLGHWEKDLSYGSWTATPGDKHIMLHIDSANDAYDMEFEIQGGSPGGDYMSWVGTRLYGMSNIAVKSIALMSKPTKKQFGVED